MSQINIHNASGGEVPNGLIRSLDGFRNLAEYREAQQMRGAAPLPDTAQRLFDRQVIQVGLERLAIVRRLQELGLTFPLPNWLAVPQLYWERENKRGHAVRTMTPGTRGERQQPDRTGKTIPIFATLDDFSFHIRFIQAAERAGTPLDTSGAGQATRRVNEAFEDQAINGGFKNAGNEAFGFLNAPNAATYQYAGGEAWDVAGKTGAEILTDVQAMVKKLQDNRFYGPYELIVTTSYDNKLNEDYSTSYPRSIRSRLQELDYGGRPLGITVADQMPANRTILFQTTDDVVDLVVGDEPTLVSWQDGPGWEFYFAVMGCMIVRVKDDYDGKSGICLGNTT